MRLFLAVVRVSGFSLAGPRLPLGPAKTTILRAIANAGPALSLTIILRILRLPPSRYHAWRRLDPVCSLDDRSSCPRMSPGQLTVAEVGTMKEMVLAPEFRHMPLRTLAVYAQRIGKVFVSATTWATLVRQRGWRRPRQRVYPAKPTLGIRASKPNEIWHIDVTILKLVDGTKAYIHAAIDNFSRKIVAFTVAARLDPAATCEVLIEASKHLGPEAEPRPTVFADSGVENVNSAVDATLATARLRRVLAQVEVTYSNSMIEAFWRSLKHQWLYLNSLDSIERVRTLVAFFVDAHNTQMPHPALGGHTPDEIYSGTAPNLADALAAARAAARVRRLAANRSASCGRCTGAQSPLEPPPNSPLIPQLPQMHT